VIIYLFTVFFGIVVEGIPLPSRFSVRYYSRYTSHTDLELRNQRTNQLGLATVEDGNDHSFVGALLIVWYVALFSFLSVILSSVCFFSSFFLFFSLPFCFLFVSL